MSIINIENVNAGLRDRLRGRLVAVVGLNSRYATTAMRKEAKDIGIPTIGTILNATHGEPAMFARRVLKAAEDTNSLAILDLRELEGEHVAEIRNLADWTIHASGSRFIIAPLLITPSGFVEPLKCGEILRILPMHTRPLWTMADARWRDVAPVTPVVS